MNKQKRAVLKKALLLLENAKALIESVRDEEQDNLDNCPENLQEGERYRAMEDAIDFLEEAIGDIDSASENVNEAM